MRRGQARRRSSAPKFRTAGASATAKPGTITITTAVEVWKFGGASLADAHAVKRAAALVTAHEGPLVVVVSALAGVTDLLLDGARGAASGDVKAGERSAAELLKKHHSVIGGLGLGGRERDRLRARVDASLQ